jgi:hypothetical protein
MMQHRQRYGIDRLLGIREMHDYNEVSSQQPYIHDSNAFMTDE